MSHQLWFEEGYSREAAEQVAEAEKEKEEKQQGNETASTGTAVHKKKKKARQPQPVSKEEKESLNQQELSFLAKHGVGFIETYEAGYGPAVEKAQRTQRRFITSMAQQGAGAAARTMTRTEQREATRAVAKTEQAKQEITRKYNEFLQKINHIYQEELNKILAMYSNYIAKGVTKVLVDTNGDGKPDTEMTLDQWRQYAINELNKWKRQAIQQLNKWKETQEKNLEAYLEYVNELLANWKKKAIESIEKYLESIRKARERARQEIKEWFSKELEKAKKVTREDEAAQLAQDIYNYVYNYLKNSGFSDEEARKIAQDYKRQFLEAAMENVKKVDEFLGYVKKLYNKYVNDIAALGSRAGGLRFGSEFYREASREIDEFLEKVAGKARELGLDLELAKQLYKPYVDALQATLHKGVKYGEAIRELDQLYNKAVKEMQSLARDIAAGKLSAIARLDEILGRFKEDAEKIATKYGVDMSKAIEEYSNALQKYADEIRGTALKYNAAQERAKMIYSTYLAEFKTNPEHYYMNIGFYKKKLREKILNELLALGVPKDYAEKLAKYYADKYEADIVNWYAERYKQLVPADFLCERIGNGLWCKVYHNGEYVTSFTVTRFVEGAGPEKNKEFYAMLSRIGYRPARIWIVGSDKELAKLELAYLRKYNPREYMSRIGGKAFKWSGGLSPKSIYKNLEELGTYVSEFYRLPSEKLMEKAKTSKNILEKVGLGALAGAGLLGAGIVSGAAEAWNLPGIVQFGKRLASGELLKAIKAKPAVEIPYMAGSLLGGALAYGAAIKGAGRLAGRISPTLGTAVPKAIETGITGALLYGAYLGARERGYKGAIPIIALTELLKAKPKTKLVEKTGEEVEVPLEKALKLIEEGKAKPELEIGGKKYVYAKISTGLGEQPVLIPEDIWRKVEAGDLSALESYLGRKVYLVTEKGVPKIVAEMKPEEIKTYYEAAKSEYIKMLEAQEKTLIDEIKRTIETIKELSKVVKERPELREQLRAEIEKLKRLRARLREIAPVEYEKLFGRVTEVKPEYRAENIAEFWKQAEKELERAERLKPVYESRGIKEFLESIEKEMEKIKTLEEAKPVETLVTKQKTRPELEIVFGWPEWLKEQLIREKEIPITLAELLKKPRLRARYELLYKTGFKPVERTEERVLAGAAVPPEEYAKAAEIPPPSGGGEHKTGRAREEEMTTISTISVTTPTITKYKTMTPPKPETIKQPETSIVTPPPVTPQPPGPGKIETITITKPEEITKPQETQKPEEATIGTAPQTRQQITPPGQIPPPGTKPYPEETGGGEEGGEEKGRRLEIPLPMLPMLGEAGAPGTGTTISQTKKQVKEIYRFA